MNAANFFDTIDAALLEENIGTATILDFDDSLRLKSGFNSSIKTHLDLEALSVKYFTQLPTDLPFQAVQSVLASNSRIISKEGIFGTDHMIDSLNPVKHSREGDIVFFKFPLAGCNPAYDLPTIGITTVEKLISKGVKGLVCDPSVTICMQRAEVLRSCDENGLFIYGTTVRFASLATGARTSPGAP